MPFRGTQLDLLATQRAACCIPLAEPLPDAALMPDRLALSRSTRQSGQVLTWLEGLQADAAGVVFYLRCGAVEAGVLRYPMDPGRANVSDLCFVTSWGNCQNRHQHCELDGAGRTVREDTGFSEI